MKSRILLTALLGVFLLGCGNPPENPNPERSSAERASALEDAATRDRPLEPGEEVVPPTEIEDEREREEILLATLLPEPTCEQQPLATPFYALMGGNTLDCGRLDPKVVAVFEAFMKEASGAESPDPEIPPLSDRLLSGPSGPGKPYFVDGDTWWYYSVCQAHQCNTTYLELLYHPIESKMVGRLIDRCAVHWLGGPTTAQRKLIDAIWPIDPLSLTPSVFCEDHAPSQYADQFWETPVDESEVDDRRMPHDADSAGCEIGGWRQYNVGEHEGGARYFGTVCGAPAAGTRFQAHDAVSGRAVCCFRVAGKELSEDDLRVGFHVPGSVVFDILNYWTSGGMPSGLHVFELVKEGALENHSFMQSRREVDGWQLMYGGNDGGLLLPEDSEVIADNLLRVGTTRYRLQSSVEMLGVGAGAMELHTLSPENNGDELRVEVSYGTEY